MSINRPDFKMGDFNTVCRDMCSEARQRIWQSNPEATFEIGGRLLKAKPTKSKSAKEADPKPGHEVAVVNSIQQQHAAPQVIPNTQLQNIQQLQYMQQTYSVLPYNPSINSASHQQYSQNTSYEPQTFTQLNPASQSVQQASGVNQIINHFAENGETDFYDEATNQGCPNSP